MDALFRVLVNDPLRVAPRAPSLAGYGLPGIVSQRGCRVSLWLTSGHERDRIRLNSARSPEGSTIWIPRWRPPRISLRAIRATNLASESPV